MEDEDAADADAQLDLADHREHVVGPLRQVMDGDGFIVDEPVVLDDLVEDCHVRLVEVVGLRILSQVVDEVADQGAVVPGLDLRHTLGRGAIGPRRDLKQE